MTLRSISFLVLTAGLALAALSRPAEACSPAKFLTPYDLFDQAAAVAVMKADKVSRDEATVSVVEVLKGTIDPAQKRREIGLRSTCSPSISKKGQRGVVYIAADGQLLGLYEGFESDKDVIAALRRYATATTAAERAAPLVDLAVGRSHTPAYQAGYALANRVELVQALDVDARERIIARLEKVAESSTLFQVAARLHDPRVATINDKRGFDDAALLAGVLAGAFDAESDPAALARTIGDASAPRADRVAAMERCEQLRGIALDELMIYSYPETDADDAEWTERAAACRTGTPR